MSSASLHEVLLRQWDHAASAGILRTNMDDTVRRRIPGDLRLIVQFNPNHVKNKRPVDEQLLTHQSDKAFAKLKDEGFKFTKAKFPEFLGGLRFLSDNDKSLPCVQYVEIENKEMVWKSDVTHFTLVNVAPLNAQVHGHLLFVPDLRLVRPQNMTSDFLRYAVSLSHAMKRNDFALGFNSAEAWSSVNHFHLQGYFFQPVEQACNFPVAAQPREKLFCAGGAIVNRLPSWKTSCYVIEPEDATRYAVDVIRISWYLLEILQSRKVPHNLIIVDAVIFIFPRQFQCENGVNLLPSDDTTTMHAGRLRVAVAELGGLVVAGDSSVYHNLTEEIHNMILQTEVSLSADEERALEAEWKAKIGLAI